MSGRSAEQPRAGLYARISLDRTGEGAGVARQFEDMRALAKRHDWIIVDEYPDNDTSAAGRKRRPHFERLLVDIESGRINVVSAWSIDRLTRNRTDTVRLVETCQRAGATLAPVRGSILDLSKPQDRMVADVLAAVARAEIEIKSDRQARANQQRAEKGLPPIGPRAMGYDSDGLTPLEPEAAAVRDAYAAVLAGASLKGLARQWNAAGLRTSRGGEWTPSAVRRVLRNPRNAGLRVHRGEVVGPGAWIPLVTEDVWRAADRVLGDPARRVSTDTKIRFLLTRIAECGRCGDGSLVATARTSRGVRTYKCVERSDLARHADSIDAYVEAAVVARLMRPDVAEALAGPREDEAAPLSARAAALRERMRELEDTYADPSAGLSMREYIKFRDRFREELTEVERRLAELTQDDALASVVAAGDVEERWHGLDVLQKRTVVQALLERVILMPVRQGQRRFDPESVRLVWRAHEAQAATDG